MNMNLEVEVAADRDRVAGLPYRADSLAGVDALAAVDQRGSRHVGVEVRAVLAFTVDQQVVAIEDRVIAGAQHLAVAHGHQRRVTGGDDVEALVGAAATAGGAEFTDRATGSVRTIDGKDVAVIGDATVSGSDAGGSWGGDRREKEER
jgi:hypothetical protein